LAEWFFEEGIGENRAILVEGDSILEAAIELPTALRAGAIAEARLSTILQPRRRAIVTLAGGEEALLEPVPAKHTEGQALTVEIVREAVPDMARTKLAKCRATEAKVRPGPSLRERIAASGHFIRQAAPVGEDGFERAGWSELLDQAETGIIPFEGGSLAMSLTPAMTLFDVDGTLNPADLAVAGATAAAHAIRRFGIAGSIGIDLPTLGDKASRQAAAAALDAALPQPFERTAVNGFGFLQIVRKRERASIPEIIQADRVGAAARALLRRAERAGGAGELRLFAAPAVIARIEANPSWLEVLARRTGVAVGLRPEPSLGISAGHVQSAFA
jgi:hypothetical protein